MTHPPKYIDIHSHTISPESDVITLLSSRLGIEPTPDHTPLSVGIHPWDVDQVDAAGLLQELHILDIAAIGEIGMDHLRPSLELQIKVFEDQLNIAQSRGLPVIIHNVKAFEEIMKTLSRYSLKGVILHGYTGSRQQTERLAGSGYYVSLGERSLSSTKTLDSLELIPPQMLFLETDDSQLNITDIYNSAAEKLGMPLDQLKTQVYNNYLNLFAR